MLRSLIFNSIRIASLNYSLFGRNKNQLFVLVFHQVNSFNRSYYPALPVNTFEDICRFISKKFNIISFSDVDDYYSKNNKPAAIITFDDGHYDILEFAHPILKNLNLKYNVNLVIDTLETGLPQDNVLVYDILNTTKKEHYYNETIKKEPISIEISNTNPSKTELEFVKLFQNSTKNERRLLALDIKEKLASDDFITSKMLSVDDVIFLQNEGVEIGSHTYSHAILPNISDEEIEFELVQSKLFLENICSKPVDIIAYPDGKCNEKVINASLKAGYKHLLLTQEITNNIDAIKSHQYTRIGFYHKSTDECLAKLFGIHQRISKIIR